jgi:hypothetical protein
LRSSRSASCRVTDEDTAVLALIEFSIAAGRALRF